MPFQISDSLYGPLRAVAALIAVLVWGSIVMHLWHAARRFRDERAAMDLAMSMAGLLGGFAFLVGAISILNPDTTTLVRFINTFVLGFLVMVGGNVLAVLHRRERASDDAAAKVKA